MFNAQVMNIAANLLCEDTDIQDLDTPPKGYELFWKDMPEEHKRTALREIPLDDKYWLDQAYTKDKIYSLFCDLIENEGKAQGVPVSVCRGLMSKWFSFFDFSVAGKYRVDLYENKYVNGHQCIVAQVVDDKKQKAEFGVEQNTPAENAKAIVRILKRLVRDGIEKFNTDNLEKQKKSV